MRLSAALRLVTVRLNRTQRRRPRLFYEAAPGLALFMADTSSRICVLAANRVGKTYQAIKKLADEMIRRPGIRCRIVGPTSKVVNRLHGSYLFRFLQDVLESGSRWNAGTGFNNFNLAKCKNGSTCEILSYEQNASSHASSSLHIVLLDEPPPIAHFSEAEARVFDTAGALWVTLTAVGRPVRWLRSIIEQGVADRAAGRGNGWSFYQLGLNRENCPWYTREQIAERVREVARTPWEFAQRIEGAWDGVSAGRRFVAFQDANLVPLTVEIRQGWPLPKKRIKLALAVDHGDGAGHAVWVLLGWQVRQPARGRPELYIRALAEWTNEHRMSVKKEAAAVKAMLSGIGVELTDILWAVGDTNAASKSETARTLNELFEAAFAELMGLDANQARLEFRPAKKGPDSVEGGISVLNDLFDTELGTARALQVSEACAHVVESLRHWEGRDDDLKHAADTVRYGVNAIVEDVGWEPIRMMAA